ncbi:hypothetical protein EDD90_2795 [Streptomyces sp. Ag109_O5-1]|uniref:hypothetical protein n=1 Tax=Streptomyces sp. Ag109_O5-1 TaxID=1938851 RepID=UPI000F4FBDAE|nr:hypothetical protein [Streptomyces sp. Ag109_O5-1]RPE39777.1 hypothetical protein EDD90_2795 [Streptomyces sp. Ag109_O5-1]
MRSTDDRFTLAAITTAAVLAAFLTAHAVACIPAEVAPPAVLAWATTYTAAVLGLARAVHLPPARTLVAATLLVAATARLVLVGIGHAVDGLLVVLAKISDVGLTMLNPPTLEGA